MKNTKQLVLALFLGALVIAPSWSASALQPNADRRHRDGPAARDRREFMQDGDPEIMLKRLQRRREDLVNQLKRVESAIEYVKGKTDAQSGGETADHDQGEQPGHARVQRRMDHPEIDGSPLMDQPGMRKPEPKEILAFLEEYQPDVAARVRRMIEREPAMRDRVLGRIGPRIEEMIQLRKRDKEMFKLRVKEFRHAREVTEATARLAGLLHRENADDQQIEHARAKLKMVINAQLDSRFAVRRLELLRLEQRVAELAEQAQDHAARRDEIVEMEMERALDRAQTMPRRSDGFRMDGSDRRQRPAQRGQRRGGP